MAVLTPNATAISTTRLIRDTLLDISIRPHKDTIDIELASGARLFGEQALDGRWNESCCTDMISDDQRSCLVEFSRRPPQQQACSGVKELTTSDPVGRRPRWYVEPSDGRVVE
jgi:hypothetical protein